MLTSLLGDRLAASVGELLTVRRVPVDEPVILVPVPSAAAAVRERGFDATGALARRAVRRLSADRPVRTVGLLAQHRGWPTSPVWTRPQRAANLRGGLRLRRGWATARVRPDGPALVVVDDLVTTGASLTEAARCLAEAGFEVLGRGHRLSHCAADCPATENCPRSPGRHGQPRRRGLASRVRAEVNGPVATTAGG